MLIKVSKKYSKNIAVIDSGIEYSYSKLEYDVNEYASKLSNLITTRNERIGLYMNNSYFYIVCFFALNKLGAIIVPIQIKDDVEKVKKIIEIIDAKIIISDENNYRKINKILDVNIITNSDINSFKRNTCKIEKLNRNEPALILFTSGTTGVPLGVVLSFNNIATNIKSIQSYLQLKNTDSILTILSFCYSYGNSVMLSHLFVGAKLIIENNALFPNAIHESIKANMITGISVVGSYANLLFKSYNDSCKNIRYITFAGESVNYSIAQSIASMYPKIKVYVMYGQTEAGARLSYLEPKMLKYKSGSVGKGLKYTKLRVINSAGSNIIPGEIGEIIASGKNIMLRYWDNIEATKKKIKKKWLYTGDLATIDSDGYIYIKGRSDDIMKINGYRISPLDIENKINDFDNVVESAVVGDNNKIYAFIVLKEDEGIPKLDDLQIKLRNCIPKYMIPNEFIFVKSLPKTVNKKIIRSELRKKILSKKN